MNLTAPLQVQGTGVSASDIQNGARPLFLLPSRPIWLTRSLTHWMRNPVGWKSCRCGLLPSLCAMTRWSLLVSTLKVHHWCFRVCPWRPDANLVQTYSLVPLSPSSPETCPISPFLGLCTLSPASFLSIFYLITSIPPSTFTPHNLRVWQLHQLGSHAMHPDHSSDCLLCLYACSVLLQKSQ